MRTQLMAWTYEQRPVHVARQSLDAGASCSLTSQRIRRVPCVRAAAWNLRRFVRSDFLLERRRIGNDRDLREPRPHDDLLSDIAARTAAIIIERTRSEQALRNNEARSSAEAHALARLNELSSRLWRMRSLSEGLDEMLAATIELVGADLGNVQMLDTESGVLVIAAQRGFK
jgi:hypothetical protein